MLACPACGSASLFEHSALMRRSDLAMAAQAPLYSRCWSCSTPFWRPGANEVGPEATIALDGEDDLWVIPRWVERTLAAEFRFSWDFTQHFFLRPRAGPGRESISALIRQVRAAALDSQLRAGQSYESLGLSRSCQHGLRPFQDHVFLTPRLDGWLGVTGLLDGQPLALERTPPAFEGELRRLIERLATAGVD